MSNLLFFFFGASIGSFIGLVRDRFPETSICFPHSRCDACGKELALRDLIPIISQLINRSRCRFCHTAFPLGYMGLEIVCGAIALLFAHQFVTLAEAFLLILSLTLSLYDMKEHQFPLLIWLIPSICLLPFVGINRLAIFFILLGILAEYRDLKIGSGDFFYLATVALTLDWQGILWVIQLASLFGLLFCRIRKQTYLPFVPFLSLAYLILVLIR